jgi:hypothetical protein
VCLIRGLGTKFFLVEIVARLVRNFQDEGIFVEPPSAKHCRHIGVRRARTYSAAKKRTYKMSSVSANDSPPTPAEPRMVATSPGSYLADSVTNASGELPSETPLETRLTMYESA